MGFFAQVLSAGWLYVVGLISSSCMINLGSDLGSSCGDSTNAGVGGDTTRGGFVVEMTIFWGSLVFMSPSIVAGKCCVSCVFSCLFTLI